MINNFNKIKLEDIRKSLLYRGFKITKIKKKNLNKQVLNIFKNALQSIVIIGIF